MGIYRRSVAQIVGRGDQAKSLGDASGESLTGVLGEPSSDPSGESSGDPPGESSGDPSGGSSFDGSREALAESLRGRPSVRVVVVRGARGYHVVWILGEVRSVRGGGRGLGHDRPPGLNVSSVERR